MKRSIKSLFLLMTVLVMTIFVSSCTERTNTDKVTAAKQEKLVTEANAQVGLPAIVNFQEKKTAKMIYELRDQEDLICYAYIVTLDAKLVFIGKCLGFGLPYSTQYSNSMKTVSRSSVGIEQLPQSEPNGLFMPDATSATWLLLLDKEGNPHPVYVEPTLIVSPFPLSF